ncbi:MAG: hypothetical protein HY665_00300 [Chloroflexi bacterium]|nr:hypothetical protein [Chloroflexota bacterium]
MTWRHASTVCPQNVGVAGTIVVLVHSLTGIPPRSMGYGRDNRPVRLYDEPELGGASVPVGRRSDGKSRHVARLGETGESARVIERAPSFHLVGPDHTSCLWDRKVGDTERVIADHRD